MMKKKYIFLLVLVAAFAGFYYLTPSFESIVKQVVHKYGSAEPTSTWKVLTSNWQTGKGTSAKSPSETPKTIN